MYAHNTSRGAHKKSVPEASASLDSPKHTTGYNYCTFDELASSASAIFSLFTAIHHNNPL